MCFRDRSSDRHAIGSGIVSLITGYHIVPKWDMTHGDGGDVADSVHNIDASGGKDRERAA
jgi:hypothetical protein